MINEAGLATRFLKAKNELLALKSSHNRGLGAIRLFGQTVYVEKQATTSVLFCDVNFTISISGSSEPFPLIKLYPKYTTASVGVIFVNRIKVSNDGYTIYISAEAILPSAASSTAVRVISTSDIYDISYTIVEDS